jgi:hypothetical protein
MKFCLQQSFSIAESSVCEGVSDSTTSTSSAYWALYKDIKLDKKLFKEKEL